MNPTFYKYSLATNHAQTIKARTRDLVVLDPFGRQWKKQKQIETDRNVQKGQKKPTEPERNGQKLKTKERNERKRTDTDTRGHKETKTDRNEQKLTKTDRNGKNLQSIRNFRSLAKIN